MPHAPCDDVMGGSVNGIEFRIIEGLSHLARSISDRLTYKTNCPHFSIFEGGFDPLFIKYLQSNWHLGHFSAKAQL